MADDWNRKSVLKSWAISRTRRWKLRRRVKCLQTREEQGRTAACESAVLSTSGTGESRGGRQCQAGSCIRRVTSITRTRQTYRCGFFTPPVEGADLRAALAASCLRGALPPVDLRAVCCPCAGERRAKLPERRLTLVRAMYLRSLGRGSRREMVVREKDGRTSWPISPESEQFRGSN
jgi:hypothetical protein